MASISSLATAPWADALPHPPEVEALAQRLRSVAAALAAPAVPFDGDPTTATSHLLEAVVAAVRADPAPTRVWLLLVAVLGAYPSVDDVDRAGRVLELDDAFACTVWLLREALAGPADGRERRTLRLVEGRVLVDVDHSARHDLHTGIQQVIRATMSRWARDHDVELVAWHEGGAGLRGLTPVERSRVVAWRGPVGASSEARSDGPLVVPWRSIVVVGDAVQAVQVRGLAGLARHSGSEVVAIGHDAIPVVSGDQVPWGAAAGFARYLSAVKWMRRVAGVSASATAEFRGFVAMLASQGVTGPEVVACPLAWSRDLTEPVEPPAGGGASPLVLAVGSLEPRKNHLALLHAAEVLWREGLDFRVEIIGGSTWGSEVSDRITALRSVGRPVEQRLRVSPAELDEAYRTARVTVFPSFHEGYGLPVAESLAVGTPVVTAGHGSTVEIAAGGGAVLVDPRDDGQLAEALRRLVTDDAELARLRAAARARPRRTWDDYARELWDLLVVPGLGNRS